MPTWLTQVRRACGCRLCAATSPRCTGRTTSEGAVSHMALWESIVIAAFGGVVALGSAWFGARWQAREAQRARREAYEREDRYRLHTIRVDAYKSFSLTAGAARRDMGLLRKYGGN